MMFVNTFRGAELNPTLQWDAAFCIARLRNTTTAILGNTFMHVWSTWSHCFISWQLEPYLKTCLANAFHKCDYKINFVPSENSQRQIGLTYTSVTNILITIKIHLIGKVYTIQTKSVLNWRHDILHAIVMNYCNL